MPDFNDRVSPHQNLERLGLSLPPLRQPGGNFAPAIIEGDLLFVSGQGPVSADGVRRTGKVGAEISVEEAYEHARIATLNLLAIMDHALGSLSRVRRIVKVLGLVNAAPDFDAHPRVINGCSDLLTAVFGEERGRHARSAVGAGSLPGRITVEIELIAAIQAR
ncbi:MAG: RidA family protein [Methylobacterium mesophilicum]|nr:RidA family protein [Methylobacterium mesophilicum]